MTPYLPITPNEIADGAIGAWEAGASILHLHVRDPSNGKPSPDPKLFMEFLPRVKQATDAVVNITTGGGHGMSLDERIAAAMATKPEMASLNMGSMNFGLFPMLKRYSNFQHAWESEMLENSRDLVFRNSYKDITYALTELNATGARYEFECYDTSHLYNLAYFLDENLVTPPLFIQTVFGLMGGIGAHPEDVMHMKRTADRLFGRNYVWSALGAGRNQLPVAAQAAAMGGNIRVGLEDSLWITAGKLATSNAQQVLAAAKIVEGLGLRLATPEEARATLALKGADRVAF
jgi:uncharacterized protein (DUF849 family)